MATFEQGLLKPSDDFGIKGRVEHLISYKDHGKSEQQKRRETQLSRQRQERRQLYQTIRDIVSEEEQASKADDEMQDSPGDKGRGKREHKVDYAKQLMLPEWMNAVPEGMNGQYFVLPRPEGKRCIVVAFNGRTTSRQRNGFLLDRFVSSLPAGGHTPGLSGTGYCLLDCIFHEPDQTYYILDLMVWRSSTIMYDSDTECRFHWLYSKLQECPGIAAVSQYNKYPFLPVPRYECTRDGLYTAYAGDFGFVKDGLLLYHKGTRYVLDSTPLVLLWKDAYCCRYFQQSFNVQDDRQMCTLTVTASGAVVTADDPPVTVAMLDPSTMAQLNIRPDSLLKFEVANVSVDPPGVGNIQLKGRTVPLRGIGDSWSKIVFHHHARLSTGVTVDMLAAASTLPPVAFEGGEHDAQAATENADPAQPGTA
eukprot:TRINITY_DN1434_c0_g1_i1.p1 TRINITY_DN1434_c0_g1~~TRINITY_DN1434_c0_g1_i1.p1  ORF type:complete len:421 (+),score=75.01 TRINITY_DN1434_c0_g1_i1:70-1332(+)